MKKKKEIKRLFYSYGIPISNFVILVIPNKRLMQILNAILRFYEICPKVKGKIKAIKRLEIKEYIDKITYAGFQRNDDFNGGILRLNLRYFTIL